MELTDPARNTQFLDRYLQFPFDLSDVLVVATANTLDPIPSSLVDRFDIIELRGYSFAEKMRIARTHVLPRLYKQLNLPKRLVTVTKAAIATIIEEYTFESGLRGLTRMLLTLLQRALAELLNEPVRVTITPKKARQYLGTPTVVHNITPVSGGPGYGVVLTTYGGTGMGAVAGMQIAITPSGAGKLYFSGIGGQGAQESAQIALSYCKVHANRWGIAAEWFSRHDIHVHLDEIAYPKQGPSAGVAMALALASAILQQPLPAKFACTGEISVDGRVLAVGGLPEKLVAAHRAGIATVLIPAVNQTSLAEIPSDVLDELRIMPIVSLDDAFKYAFPPDSSMVMPYREHQDPTTSGNPFSPSAHEQSAAKAE
jgi:ATP-dependent Lon protease